MKSLLLVAHGSRRAESNAEIERLAARLAERLAARLAERLASRADGPPDERAAKGFGHVGHAFLEIAEPSIPDGIERCIREGATEVRVLPYFLARGTHVAVDIPAEVDGKRAEHPDVDIRITDYLGTADALVDVLIALAD